MVLFPCGHCAHSHIAEAWSIFKAGLRMHLRRPRRLREWALRLRAKVGKHKARLCARRVANKGLFIGETRDLKKLPRLCAHRVGKHANEFIFTSWCRVRILFKCPVFPSTHTHTYLSVTTILLNLPEKERRISMLCCDDAFPLELERAPRPTLCRARC